MTGPVTFRVPTVLAVVAALLAAGGGTASAAGSPVLASQKSSPYATSRCLALDNQPGSLNYLNSEVEPMVSVDPTDSSHLVGAWQQDRWNNGGSHGLVAGYSTDGGTTWHVSPQPFSVCYQTIPGNEAAPYLNYQRASDPWVSIGPGAPGDPTGSTVYSDSISFDQTPYPGDPNAVDNAVGAAVSYDGGATWINVQTVIADPCVSQSSGAPGYVCNNSKSFIFNDKNSITADPTTPGVAYAVWDRLVAPPANPHGFIHERAYFGQAYMSKTTDYGQTWSTPQTLTSLASQDQTIANQIVVNHQSGQLYDFFTLIQNASNAGGHRGLSVAYVTSTNHGATWSKPRVVSAIDTVGVSDPINLNPDSNAPPAPSRTGDIIPEPAINPNNGQLYVVWQDARFNSFANDEAVISTSSDGGATWSAPELVNDHTGQPAYNPTVYVSPTGTVGVTYLQWGTTVSGNEPTTLNIKHSLTPGSSTKAPTFDAATVVDGPFNNLAAPYAGGYFLGDYAGLAFNATSFVPFYVKTNCADGGSLTQPSCRALASVLNPTDVTPTDKNSTDVYAAPGS